MKKILFLILCISSGIVAQNMFTISGFVKEKSSAEELIGVNVVSESPPIGVTTNVYGFYSISLPEGNHKILYSYIGYQDKVVELALTKSIRLDLEMNPYAQELSEIVLEAAAMPKVLSIEMSVNSLDVKSVKELPAVLGVVDIIKIIQLLPGVTSVGESANGYNVRGGSSDENLVLLDEMNLFNSSHLFGFFSVFNTDAIKDVKLYKGGIPAEYGGRISSVLDIHQKEGNANSYHTSGGIGLISSRLMLEGPLWDKSSFMIAGRRSFGDLFLLLSKNESINSSQLHFYDLNMKFNSWLGDKDRFFLSTYSGEDVFKFGSVFHSSWGNKTLNARWLHLFSDKLVSNLSYNYNKYNYLISLVYDNRILDWDSKIKNNNFKYNFSYFHSNTHQFMGGVSLNTYHFEPGIVTLSSGSSEFTSIEMRNKFAYEPAVFIQDQWKISDRLLVKVGLRWSSFYRLGVDTMTVYADGPLVYDEFQNMYVNGDSIDSDIYAENEIVASYNAFEPRLAIRYKLNDLSSIKTSYQKINQYMHLITNASSPTPLDIWAPAGEFIKPLIGQQFALGYFYSSKNLKWDFSTEVYYKKLDNVLDYIDGADLELNNNLETEILYGDGRAYGLELMLEKKQGKVKGWIAYTLAKSESLIPGLSDSDPGINFGEWYNNRQDKTHDLSIVAFYKHNKKWSFSSSFIFATGIPTNYPSAKYEYEGLTIPQYTERNEARLPNYHRLDLAATLQPLKNENRKWHTEWIFSIYNVYNRKNASSLYFRQSRDDESITEAVQLSIFPIIPSVSYNFKF